MSSSRAAFLRNICCHCRDWAVSLPKHLRPARPQDASHRAGNSPAVSSPGRWRAAARIIRPLVLTIVAALAFMALLRLHHAKFEDRMVRAFQRQQLEAIRSWADSMQGQMEGIRRDLFVLANQVSVSGMSPGMDETLSAFASRERSVLEKLEVLDAGSKKLWSSKPASDASEGEGTEGASFNPLDRTRRFVVRLPIEREGQPAGFLQATVNICGLALSCQPKANSAYRSLCCLLSSTGEVLYGSDSLSTPRRLVGFLRDADAHRDTVRHAELLPYIMDRCVVKGGFGLAEAVREGPQAEELIAFAPVNLEGGRMGLVIGSPRADVSVPIASHERVTYALITALALLYFATGYTAYRSEWAHIRLEEHRRELAEKASIAKGDFLSRMSHEIRTPLNGIIGMTELAIQAHESVQRQRCLAVVKECSHSLLSVINDILDMSRIEAGKLTLCPAPLNLSECIATTLAPLAAMAADKGLALRWQVDAPVPEVLAGDRMRLRQVLTNLLSNAIKFTSQGNVDLHVELEGTEGEQVCLRWTVRDTGPGISPENQQQLFRPYDQAVGKPQPRDSTGLGLSIAKQLVELMGGRIWVESDGTGSAFHFTASLGTVKVGSPAVVSLPPLADAMVLIVSRASTDVPQLTDLLEAWGVQAVLTPSIDSALGAIRKSAQEGEFFDLVLVNDDEAPADISAFAEGMARQGAQYVPALVLMYAGDLRVDMASSHASVIDAYVALPVRADAFHTALRLALQRAGDRNSSFDDSGRKDPPLNILLVEDNPVNQQSTSMLLQGWGHQVRTALSGEESLAILEKTRFDLVLMDVQMPGIGGIEATRQIRQREAAGAPRNWIVAMTAQAMEADRTLCLEAGMDDYLSKPVRPEQLRRHVRNVAVGVLGRRPAAAPPFTPPRQEAPPPWDIQEARELAGGNDSTLELVIEAFLTDIGKSLPAAEQAAARHDSQELGKLAHRWKSALGVLGAKPARSQALALEEACRGNEPEHVTETFEKLREELAHLQTALARHAKEATHARSDS